MFRSLPVFAVALTVFSVALFFTGPVAQAQRLLNDAQGALGGNPGGAGGGGNTGGSHLGGGGVEASLGAVSVPDGGSGGGAVLRSSRDTVQQDSSSRERAGGSVAPRVQRALRETVNVTPAPAPSSELGAVGQAVAQDAERVGATAGQVAKPLGKSVKTVTQGLSSTREQAIEPVLRAVDPVSGPVGETVGKFAEPVHEAVEPVHRKADSIAESVVGPHQDPLGLGTQNDPLASSPVTTPDTRPLAAESPVLASSSGRALERPQAAPEPLLHPTTNVSVPPPRSKSAHVDIDLPIVGSYAAAAEKLGGSHRRLEASERDLGVTTTLPGSSVRPFAHFLADGQPQTSVTSLAAAPTRGPPPVSPVPVAPSTAAGSSNGLGSGLCVLTLLFVLSPVGRRTLRSFCRLLAPSAALYLVRERLG